MIPTIDLVPDHLRPYAGFRYETDDQRQRASQMSFTLMTECLAPGYTPFGRISRNGLLINDETRELLYGPDSDFGHIRRPYRKGQSVLLERYIDSLITPGMSDGEKVIALSQSMYDELPRRYPKVPTFLYGESDEQTLLKGGGHCSCKGRLLSAMCQMIGLQARPAMMWVWYDRDKNPDKILGGHTVAEVLIDGQWGFFDPQHHLYCQSADGRFHSIDDIRRNPELFTRMPDSITQPMDVVGYNPQDMGDMNTFEYYWYKNFNPHCPTQISRHDVTEPYVGKWTWSSAQRFENQAHDMALFRAILDDLASRGELTNDIYRLSNMEFRQRFNITTAKLQPQTTHDHAGRPLAAELVQA